MRKRLLITLSLIGSGLALVIGGYLYWYTHRAQPPDEQRTLLPGVEYIRRARTIPTPMVFHVVRIDLDTPGLRFLVTPASPSDNFDMSARTTSDFVQASGVQLAINGDFFDPWRDYGFWDYYPHSGDGVNLHGLAISQGELVSEGYAAPVSYKTLYLDDESHAAFDPGELSGEVYNAISGNQRLLIEGESTLNPSVSGAFFDYHPRTAVGIDASGRTMIWIIVDGRQPNYSDGATLNELVDLLREFGAHNAINLDGGGSASLVRAGDEGQPQVLNTPIHNRIIGRERPVANHLGLSVGHSTEESGL